MKLGNLEKANELARLIKTLQDTRNRFADGRAIEKIVFYRGGQNVDVTLTTSDRDLVRLLEHTTVEHIDSRIVDLEAELEEL
jgi:hypothetical protein